MVSSYDIIVIGAGHAGCEAAVAAARLGSRVLLVTHDMTKIARMSCNPAMGGIAKGQLVREIDALGGWSGIVTDASTLQFRMLNRSKGPAMWSPRAQCDKTNFSLNWRYILENTCGLDIWQDSVTEITFRESKISGVRVGMGAEFGAKTVILTAGTFLEGKLYVGLEMAEGGRMGEASSRGLSAQLVSAGLKAGRMKTGTPPRIDVRSVDLSKLQQQFGDETPGRFSYLPIPTAIQQGSAQKCCYIVHTNERVHDILRTGFDRSPLFTGRIQGIGPRYCPSIEDKLRTFAGKDAHQLFLEPEGWHTHEYYLQGFSSSLPLETQLAALRAMEGFAQVRIFRPAYAVEYDYFDPADLNSTLESRIIPGLYLAGQVNGTTGYEEAAAQGLMAGINAHLKLAGRDPFVLKRDQAYIGVLIDDLITKTLDEPYRMFTSRAEYRILLRQDNADERLTEIARKIGLVDDFRWKAFQEKKVAVEDLTAWLQGRSVKPAEINAYLTAEGESPIDTPKRASDLLVRPFVTLDGLLANVPRGTMRFPVKPGMTGKVEPEGTIFVPPTDTAHHVSPDLIGGLSVLSDPPVILSAPPCHPERSEGSKGQMFHFAQHDTGDVSASLNITEPRPTGANDRKNQTGFDSAADQGEPLPLKLPWTGREKPAEVYIDEREVVDAVEVRVKYAGYIERESRLAEKILRLENLAIPEDFDFQKLTALSMECRIKLDRYRPRTIAQASRISGVSPADISVLLVYFGR